VSVRYCANQAMTRCGSAIQPDHVRLGPGFIDEDQPARGQLRLILPPFRTGLGDIRPVLFGRPERLLWDGPPLPLGGVG
jgi:hypothetical protein